MRLIYLFRRLAFAQVMLGIVAFCIAEPNPGMLLIAGAIGSFSWYVTEGPTGRPLPRWLINVGSLATVGWLLFDLAWQRNDVIVAMGHFMMWLQILLLYTPKSNREYAQLLVLSLMQMIGASVLSVSMIYGLLLIAYCVLALMTILLLQLKTASDQVFDANRAAAPDPRHITRPKPVVGRGYRWHFRVLAIAIGLSCATVAVAVFVVMPRTAEFPIPGRKTNPLGQTQVGFSQQVNLSLSPSTEGSKQPVLNFRIHNQDPKNDVDNTSYLLRGAALDEYDLRAHIWKRSNMRFRDRSLALEDDGLTLGQFPDGTEMSEATITLRLEGYRTLFSVLPISHINSTNISQVVFNLDDQQLSADDSVAGAVIYTIRWPVSTSENIGQIYRRTLDPDGQRVIDLAGVQADTKAPIDGYARAWSVQPDRVRALVQSIITPLGLHRDPLVEHDADDPLIAKALAEYLQENYQYALGNPLLRPSEDPVIEFLFTHRQGHCELFAAGLGAMVRSIGIPARLVTGYRASEYNHIGGYYIVRKSNAHAWTEIYCGPDLGWQVFDATPPLAVQQEHAVARTWLTSLRELYEHIEFAWISSVVAYDQRTRKAVISGINRSFSKASSNPESWLGAILKTLGELPNIWRLDRLSYSIAGFIIFAIVLGLISLIHTVLVRRRRLATLQLTSLPRRNRRQLIRKLRFYLLMLDMLERHGHVRPAWQSPFGFAQELAQAHPMGFDPVVILTELFYEIRFGHRQLTPRRRDCVRKELRLLEEALSAKPTPGPPAGRR